MTAADPVAPLRGRRPLGRGWLLAAFAVSGGAALSYEVIWTRALSTVLGSTTYAVSSMLATFMLGLAVGGLAGGHVADRTTRPVFLLGLCELGIGVVGVASLLAEDALPAAYLWVYRSFHLAPAAFFTVQIGLCAAVMLLPTALMGMTFPLLTRAVIGRVEEVGGAVGNAYAANTIGAVAGALLAGFVLIPSLGLTGAAIATGCANVAVGVALVMAASRAGAVALAGLVALAGITVAVGSAPEEWTLVSFYTASRYLDGRPLSAIDEENARMWERVYSREGMDARVAAFRGGAGELVLQVGGKLEGTTVVDRVNTALLAYLPVAAHAGPRRMLVVGLGAGVTLQVAKRLVPDVELVEISEGVIDAIEKHGPPGLLRGVRVHRNDARMHLLLGEARYDVISSEPSYPTSHAVGNLFTREHFALAAGRLADGGVYCQWLPRYLLADEDVDMMLKTFGSVFPFTSAWHVPDSDDLLLIGSRVPFVRDAAATLLRVTELNGGTPLPFALFRDPAAVAAVVRRADVPINTDDHAVLEYRVANALRVGARQTH